MFKWRLKDRHTHTMNAIFDVFFVFFLILYTRNLNMTCKIMVFTLLNTHLTVNHTHDSNWLIQKEIKKITSYLHKKKKQKISKQIHFYSTTWYKQLQSIICTHTYTHSFIKKKKKKKTVTAVWPTYQIKSLLT